MKNYKECIEALLAGEALIFNNGDKFWIDKDTGEQKSSNRYDNTSYSFDLPQDWEIFKDWREELNGKKTLCWVKDGENEKWSRNPHQVVKYTLKIAFPFVDSYGERWKYAKRLTKSEIQEYMKNAPDVKDDY